MNELFIEEREFDIAMMKANHVYESSLSSYYIEMMELSMQESVDDILYENAVSNLGEKIKTVVESILKAIRDFFGKLKSKVTRFISKKEKEELKEAVKNVDKIKSKEKVKMYDSEKNKELLNEYIREMAKLERKVLNMKIDAKRPGLPLTGKNDTLLLMEYQKIDKEIDKLNEKYGNELLEENKLIIDMALKDAIRFADKELDNIQVNYDALEKDTEKILERFKVDADGCKVPYQLNLFKKIINSISTMVRKSVSKSVSYKHRSFKKMFGLLAAAGFVTAYRHGKPELERRYPDQVHRVEDSVRNGHLNVQLKMKEKTLENIRQILNSGNSSDEAYDRRMIATLEREIVDLRQRIQRNTNQTQNS